VAARTVYWVGEFRFPDGDAGSLRVLGNAMALHAAGYKVRVVGRGDPKTKEQRELSAQGSVNCIPYDLINEYGPPTDPQWKRVLRFITGGKRLVSWLKTNASEDAAAIVLSEGYSDRKSVV
jgi:hypothetical protein